VHNHPRGAPGGWIVWFGLVLIWFGLVWFGLGLVWFGLVWFCEGQRGEREWGFFDHKWILKNGGN
jgi:hypothetical protein